MACLPFLEICSPFFQFCFSSRMRWGYRSLNNLIRTPLSSKLFFNFSILKEMLSNHRFILITSQRVTKLVLFDCKFFIFHILIHENFSKPSLTDFFYKLQTCKNRKFVFVSIRKLNECCVVCSFIDSLLFLLFFFFIQLCQLVASENFVIGFSMAMLHWKVFSFFQKVPFFFNNLRGLSNAVRNMREVYITFISAH